MQGDAPIIKVIYDAGDAEDHTLFHFKFKFLTVRNVLKFLEL